MRAIRLSVAVLVVLMGGGASLVAQQKPNFTGHWVIVGSVKGVSQEQVVTVDDKTLMTARPDGTRKTIYQLDGVERRMALPSNSGMASDITMLASAKWDGTRILITTTTSYGAGMRIVQKDVWSIDPQGRLVIDSTETGPGAPPPPKKFVFTRKGKAL